MDGLPGKWCFLPKIFGKNTTKIIPLWNLIGVSKPIHKKPSLILFVDGCAITTRFTLIAA
jgi:hypothetical protein